MATSILLVFILSHSIVRWPTEAQERIGCFSFNHNNTVLSVKAEEGIGSITACVELCKTYRATYAGVRFGHQCHCGDNQNHTVNGEQLSDSRCRQECNDHKPLCGKQFSIVIYSVCSRGGYHDNTNGAPNCDASCNCQNNHICLYNTGSCPAKCESGWSGEACNVRVVQPTTEAATPIMETDNRVAGLPQTKVLTDESAKANVAGTNPSERVDPNDKDGISVTAVAVGVSSAVLALIAIIALIVFFRGRRKPHKSGDENDERMTNPGVKTDHWTAKQMENGPSIYTATESPEPCYSSVDYLNNGPANIDSKDIPKSDDGVAAINGEHEMVEYAVVKKPGVEKHLNLKENSLYGTNAWDSDEEG